MPFITNEMWFDPFYLSFTSFFALTFHPRCRHWFTFGDWLHLTSQSRIHLFCLDIGSQHYMYHLSVTRGFCFWIVNICWIFACCAKLCSQLQNMMKIGVGEIEISFGFCAFNVVWPYQSHFHSLFNIKDDPARATWMYPRCCSVFCWSFWFSWDLCLMIISEVLLTLGVSHLAV